MNAETALELVRIEKEKRRRAFADQALLDFIPAVTPNYYRPDYLAPMTSRLDRICAGEPLRVLISVPPQHGKTETLLHFIVKYLLKYRSHAVGYASYEAGIARSKSIQTHRIAERSLFPFGDRQAIDQWETDEEGKLIVAGVGGPMTGFGLNGIIIDDPHKNYVEASSKVYRDRIADWFASVAETRLAPGGWIVVNQTRWHEDDLYGRLKASGEYEDVNIPALTPDDETGEALCPLRKPKDELLSFKRRNPYFWGAMYQGAPTPLGSLVFKNANYYDELPDGLTIAIGLDFNYGKNPKSDFSVYVVLGVDVSGNRYVLDVWRDHVRTDEFEAILKACGAKYANPPTRTTASGSTGPAWSYLGMFAFAASTERGVIDLVNAHSDLAITFVQADTNKFIRALNVAGDWNEGRVLLPSAKYQEDHGRADWLEPFISEVGSFTGKSDPNDDQVDGLAGANFPFVASGSFGGLWV